MRLSWQEVLLDPLAGNGVRMISHRRFEALSRLLYCSCFRCAAVLASTHISTVPVCLLECLGFLPHIVIHTFDYSRECSAGMWAPGIVGVVIGLLLLVVVKDSPEKIGYPPVEIVKPNKVQYMQTLSDEYTFSPNPGSVMLFDRARSSS